MTVPMHEDALHARIYDLLDATPSAAIELGDQQWPTIRARTANKYDAETCRLLSLAALGLPEPNWTLAELYRCRALARFALIGWSEGVAAVMMGTAFAILGDANQGYSRGRSLDVIVGSPEALAVFDELEPFTTGPGSGISVGDRSPTPSLIERFLHEKRGFMLLTLREFDAARASYEKAARVAVGSARGALRVRLGALLVDYVAGSSAGAVSAQADLVEAAAELGHRDLLTLSQHNLSVMSEGGANVLSYEML